MDKEIIRQRLYELGMSKEEFAVKVGCSIATVYNALGGKKLTREHEYRVKLVLGLTQENTTPAAS